MAKPTNLVNSNVRLKLRPSDTYLSRSASHCFANLGKTNMNIINDECIFLCGIEQNLFLIISLSSFSDEFILWKTGLEIWDLIY